MHALLHTIASVLVLPYLALAAMFLLIDEAAKSKGLFSLLDVAVRHTDWIAAWGIYWIPLLWLFLVAAGWLHPFRKLASLAIGLLAAVSLLVVFILHSSRMDPGQLLFLAPCFGIVALEIWLVFRTNGVH